MGNPNDTNHQEGWRYFQYLESSCFQLIQKQFEIDAENLNQHIQSVIKLHALLGCRIVLNSSSPLELQVAHLFSDPDFRTFVSDHPTFLKLTSIYTLPESPSRRDIVLASMSRVTSPEWVSSSIQDSDAIKRLASVILENEELDAEFLLHDERPGRAASIIRGSSQHRWYLEGMVRAVSHFVCDRRTPVATPEGRRPGIHEILSMAENEPKFQVSGRHASAIETTNHFIARNFDKDPIDVSMSEVITKIRAEHATHPTHGGPLKIDDPIRYLVLETASHAYNAGMASAMQPDVGSYAFYKYGAPIGVYIDGLRDILLPTTKLIRKPSGYQRALRFIGFKWHPGDITWQQVKTAFEDAEVLESAHQLQKLLLFPDPEVHIDALQRHIKLLEPYLVDVPAAKLKPWMWIVDGVAFMVGVFVPTEWQDIVDSVKRSSEGAGLAEDAIRKAIGRGQRYIIANTLREVGQKAKARPQIRDESTYYEN